MTDSQKIAVVTGGSRGIGFEVCHQLGLAGYRILFTSKQAVPGEKALEDLRHFGIQADYYSMDVSKEDECKAFEHWVYSHVDHVDILVNNAGVFLDTQDHAPLSKCSTDRLNQTLSTNVYGPIYITRLLAKLLEKSGHGHVVNMSSQLGQLQSMTGGFPAYRLSKLAINGVTRIFAEELAAQSIRVNSMCPGWCRTDMGSESAPRTAAEGASDVVWLATSQDKITGKFFHDRVETPW